MKLYTQICPAAFARRTNCSARRDLYSWPHSLCHVIKWQKIYFRPANELFRPATPSSSARRTRGGPRQKLCNYFPHSPGELNSPPGESHHSAFFISSIASLFIDPKLHP